MMFFLLIGFVIFELVFISIDLVMFILEMAMVIFEIVVVIFEIVMVICDMHMDVEERVLVIFYLVLVMKKIDMCVGGGERASCLQVCQPRRRGWRRAAGSSGRPRG